MSALVLLAVIVAAVAALRAARRRLRSGLSSRSRAMLIVVAIIGAQAAFGAPAAYAEECGEAPNPDRPGSGMVGALDPAKGRGEAGSAYSDYSYAGTNWYVYESDCGPMSGITDPSVTIDTWAGNQLFNVGKNIVGATNALHYTVMQGGLFTPIYDAVKKGTDAVYNNIYAQLFGLAALLLAIMMFRHIWRGDLPAVGKRAMFALGAVWLAASSFALLRYYDKIDTAIVQTTTNIQAGFVDESDRRVVKHVLPTNLHNEIIYKNWLRGEFGSPEAKEAKKYGRELLDAQAFTWDQMKDGDDGDEAVIEKKKQKYKEIAQKLGPSEGYFTGEDGSRTGAGLIAMLQSIVYSLFQLLAKLAVLLAQVVVRLLTLTAPLIGLVALLHHDILRRVAKVAGAVAFNLIVLSVLAGVHALLLNAIFAASGSLSMLTQMAMAGLVTILLFLVGRPVRRLWQMVEMSTQAIGSALPSGPGLFSRFRRTPEGPTAQDEFWQNVRDTGDTGGPVEAPGALGTATASGRRLRPEANAPVPARAQRLDAAAVGNSEGSAALATAAGRPALPAGGTPDPVRLGFTPAGGRDDGMLLADGSRPAIPGARPDGVLSAHAERITPAQLSRTWTDDGDNVVIPSRMAYQQPEYASVAGRESIGQPPPAQPPAVQPRRAEAEVINGRPVFVVYRPSRGLEVRQDLRDTDTVVR